MSKRKILRAVKKIIDTDFKPDPKVMKKDIQGVLNQFLAPPKKKKTLKN